MSSWSTRRQIGYAALVLGFLALVIGVPVFILFSGRTQSCFDGVKNQDERGIDCGGRCDAACQGDALLPTVLWSRAFRVTDGVYNLVALVENRNIDLWARGAAYSFKLFDKDNLLILEINGMLNIPAQSIVPVFESSVNTGNRIPARTFFQFTEPITFWESIPEYARMEPLEIVGESLTGYDFSPRLSARIVNDSAKELTDIGVVSVIYSREGNALAASRTVIDTLKKGESKEIVFTWPEPFSAQVGRINIIPVVLPNNVIK